MCCRTSTVISTSSRLGTVTSCMPSPSPSGLATGSPSSCNSGARAERAEELRKGVTISSSSSSSSSNSSPSSSSSSNSSPSSSRNSSSSNSPSSSSSYSSTSRSSSSKLSGP